jgi:EAL and modified HD-GYP domain-containing signal transduction protein
MWVLDSFIARQPIFDEHQSVFGYELLFRSGLDNVFRSSDPDQATSKVLTDSLSLFSMATLTGGKRGFINITRDILLKDYVFLIPNEQIVVEVLETIRPDAEVIEACRRLKEGGYLLAMDDFVYSEAYQPLVDLADFIKVDFLQTQDGERKGVMEKCRAKEVRFLAEKVENLKTFDEARKIGYSFFQGYFFSKPTVLTRKDIPKFKLHYLRILQEIHRPEMNFNRLGEYIKQEISLSYKLLRYINAPVNGLQQHIRSIAHALVILGYNQLYRWLTLLLFTSGSLDSRNRALLQTALARARMTELLGHGKMAPGEQEGLFLVGIFSLLDALLNEPMEQALARLKLPDPVIKALVRREGIYAPFLALAMACEEADQDNIAQCAAACGLDADAVNNAQAKALIWVEEINS